eukprot:tig00020629_g12349.t1
MEGPTEDAQPQTEAQADTPREAETPGSVAADLKLFVTAKTFQYLTEKQLTKQLQGANIRFKRVKKNNMDKYAFVIFDTPEDKEAAREPISALRHKGKPMKIGEATPLEHDRFKKRQRKEGSGSDGEEADAGGAAEGAAAEGEGTGAAGGGGKRRRGANGEGEGGEKKDAPRTAEDATTPLWTKPYEDQLRKKRHELLEFLRQTTKAMAREMAREKKPYPSWMAPSGRVACTLVSVEASPVVEGYRNKCEFSIGYAPDSPPGSKPVVGFMLGLFRDGVHSVGASPFNPPLLPCAHAGHYTLLLLLLLPASRPGVANCRHVSPAAKAIAGALEEHLASSALPPYDQRTHAGYWRGLLVRQGVTGEVMAVIHVAEKNLADGGDQAGKRDVAEAEIQALAARMGGLDLGEGMRLASLLVHVSDGMSNAGVQNECRVLTGASHIHDQLFDLIFRISPSAFFQVNTKCAEVLYGKLREWADLGPGTTLLDVCCGTGTIGLVMSRSAERVIGVDIVEETVEDARSNAALNGIHNCSFMAGRAEKVLPGVVAGLPPGPVVAIVDPPRSGLHNDVIRALRGCPKVERVLYVSCSPSSFVNNSVNFCRPPSRGFPGTPFKPSRACGVDLFPHTAHCELVVELVRAEGAPALCERHEKQRGAHGQELEGVGGAEGGAEAPALEAGANAAAEAAAETAADGAEEADAGADAGAGAAEAEAGPAACD